MPTTILSVCWPEPGHIMPMVPVLRRLGADGYRVVILDHPLLCRTAQATGF